MDDEDMSDDERM